MFQATKFITPFRSSVVILLLMLLTAAHPAKAQTIPDIAGTWQGTLSTGKELRIVLKIAATDNTNLQVVVYSIDSPSGSDGRAATSISLRKSEFQFTVVSMEARFEGKLIGDGSSISGTWIQGKQSNPLAFSRANSDTAWAIPLPFKPMSRDADPEFEVATIKLTDPDWHNSGFHKAGQRVFADNRTMNDLISFAFSINLKQLVNAPSWFGTERYSIDGHADIPGSPDLQQQQSMYRKLLVERFHLTLHIEKKEQSVYAIRLANSGPKLGKSLSGTSQQIDISGGPSGMRFTNASMGDFRLLLQSTMPDRPVVDQTGLAGRFNFFLKWTPDGVQTDDPNAPPSIFTAVQEQLGLRLEPIKAPVDLLVIDHVERPSEN